MSTAKKQTSKRYLREQMDWKHYREAVFRKFIADGLSRADAEARTQEMVDLQDRIKREAIERKEKEAAERKKVRKQERDAQTKASTRVA